MENFKEFLSESYNAIAQDILQDYFTQAAQLKHKPEPIEYNVIDKEYFFNVKTKKGEFSIYIDRTSNKPFILNMDNGDKDLLQNKNDLKKYL